MDSNSLVRTDADTDAPTHLKKHALQSRSSTLNAESSLRAAKKPFEKSLAMERIESVENCHPTDLGVAGQSSTNSWKSINYRFFLISAVVALVAAVATDIFVFRSPRTQLGSIGIAGRSSELSVLPPNSAAVQVTEIMGAEAFADFPEQELIFTGSLDGLLHRIHVTYADHAAIRVDSRPVLRMNTTDVGDGSMCVNGEAESSCGRILGLKVVSREPHGPVSVVACDSVRGLVHIEDVLAEGREFTDFRVSVLTDTVDDSTDRPRIRFCNSVEVRGESVFFTDSSTFPRKELVRDFLESAPTGRLLRFDFRTGKTQTLVDKLHFANGLVLTHEEDALIFSEMRSSRILRLPLRFVDEPSGITFPIDALTQPELLNWSSRLPIMPDNIQLFPDGSSYLVGGSFATPNLFAELLFGSRLFRQALKRLPVWAAWRLVNMFRNGGSSYALLLMANGSIDTALDTSLIGPSSLVSDAMETKWSRILLLGSYDAKPLVVAPGLASLLLH